MTPLGDAIEIFSISRQHSFQMFHDSRRCLPVPERRARPLFPLSGHQSRECGRKLAGVGPNELVCANRDGFRYSDGQQLSQVRLQSSGLHTSALRDISAGSHTALYVMQASPWSWFRLADSS